MIERIAHIRGRRRLVIEVPVLSPRLSSYWLHLVTPVRAGIARPLIEGLRNPTVVRNDRLHRLLPFALTPFDDAARIALAEGSCGAVLIDRAAPAPWCDSVRPGGFEPPTRGLEVRRSVH